MDIFDKIIARQIPAQIEYEDDKTLVFHDINPQAPIHLLAIPKTHVTNFHDVTPEIMADLMVAIKAVAQKMGLDKSGYRLVTNNGEDAGQEVMHLHFHILGGTRLGHVHSRDTSRENL
jgi:histidine triad (HIT) family protein